MRDVYVFISLRPSLIIAIKPITADIDLPELPNKPITNTAWVRARICKLQKSVHSTRSRK
jgi:hypothetical protein